MKPRGNLIDGAWIAGPEIVENRNPSDLADAVGEFAFADIGIAEAAVAAAKRAQPAWASATPQFRAECLAAIGQELLRREDELGRQLSREEGKTLAEGLAEVKRAGQIFHYFAGEALRLHGDWMESLRPGIEGEVRREALGIALIITPWNFPIGVAAWKSAAALACGNAVILKPAELVPASAWSLAEIVAGSAMPPGVFNLVLGRGESVGQALVEHPDIAAISFTGSTAIGRRIAAAASQRFCRVQLEMGGKNPLLVMADADLDAAAEAAFQSAFLATGQRCTAASRLIVVDSVHDAFVERLLARLRAARIGHALAPETNIGPVVDERQLRRDLDYIELGRREGAHLAYGGDLLERPTRGYYLDGALFTGSDNRMRLNREEIFGPIAGVIAVRDYEEALAVANDCDYGLTAALFTRSLKLASDFKRRSETGLAVINLPTAGVDYNLPFGGRKQSSFGPRETGIAAKDFFTLTKTAYTRPL